MSLNCHGWHIPSREFQSQECIKATPQPSQKIYRYPHIKMTKPTKNLSSSFAFLTNKSQQYIYFISICVWSYCSLFHISCSCYPRSQTRGWGRHRISSNLTEKEPIAINKRHVLKNCIKPITWCNKNRWLQVTLSQNSEDSIWLFYVNKITLQYKAEKPTQNHR